MYVDNGTKEIYEELAKIRQYKKEYSYYYQTSLDFDNMKYASEFGKETKRYVGNSMISLTAYNNEYF